MLNDSVREELAPKIMPLNKADKLTEIKPESPNAVTTKESAKYIRMNNLVKKQIIEPKYDNNQNQVVNNITHPSNSVERLNTAEIMIKNTSQTLVDFQNKNATIPDWRLQLQNSVRRRLDGQKIPTGNSQPMQTIMPRKISQMTSGATALKADYVEDTQPQNDVNSTVANALRRIEESRKRFFVPNNLETKSEEVTPQIEVNSDVASQTTVKQFPNLLKRSADLLPNQDKSIVLNEVAKQNVVQFSTEVKTETYNTAKLPPTPLPAKFSSSFNKKTEPKKIEINWDEIDDDIVHDPAFAKLQNSANYQGNSVIEEVGEAEDYAPIALRFNAAIFDLLIGSFLSLILLSPFMILNGRFFSLEGFFAFLATCSIVMFIYLTTTIGFLGRTFGMRLFGLEIIDIEENDYPSLHQAAVSSSVYLLSLAFGGLGFLTMLINREKRAAHDLLSHTIIVKEY